MAKLLEGKPLAEKIASELKRQLKQLKCSCVLASIEVGAQASSAQYIAAQKKTAVALGIEFRHCTFDADVSEDKLIEFIDALNNDPQVQGVIVQLPLPKGIDSKRVISSILPVKDVEGLSPQHLGNLISGKPHLAPCTALAALEMIKSSGVDLYGKEAVVVGASEVIGKPIALLLLEAMATVTVCHIATSQAGRLEDHVRRADILVVAVGKPGVVKGSWVKKGAVVIDVGINKVNNATVGDVEFDGAEKNAAWITPVPGGVGPLTVMMLMRNLVEAVKSQNTHLV